MTSHTSTLDAHYRDLNDGNQTTSNDDYADLVTPDSVDPGAFHRWFKMKEAYSPRFLPRVTKDLGLDAEPTTLRIVDPFSGSGTTAVSAAQLSRPAYVVGTECNPFLHLLASSKQRSIQERPSGVADLGQEVVKAAAARLAAGEQFRKPKLSTFLNKKYFDPKQLRRLLAIVAVLDDYRSERPGLDVDLLRVAAAATVEPISSLRRDGRALRYWANKDRATTFDEFERRSLAIESDVAASGFEVGGRQIHGDARAIKNLLPDEDSLDLAIFSPPYPNNIDYTEVYKLENWLLSFITSRDDFRAQRLRTLHSHPSLRRTVSPDDLRAVDQIVAPLVASVADGRYRGALTEMLAGYVIDMSKTFRSLHDLLRPGGSLVFAVGNSAHGTESDGIVVASDVLLTAAARRCGFEDGRIEIARALNRKQHQSEFLRESVCILTRSPDRV